MEKCNRRAQSRRAFKLSSLGLVSGLALMVGMPAVVAQDDEELEEIVVTGIRGSLEQSISTKRNAALNAQGPTISPYVDMSFGNGVGTDGAAFNDDIDPVTGKFNQGVWQGIRAQFMTMVNGEWGILAPRTKAITAYVSEQTMSEQVKSAKAVNKANLQLFDVG